jgi:cytochrome c553
MRAILVLGVAACLSTPAVAGDAAAGAAKAKQVCAACHGEDGNKPLQPDFPKLGGQHYDYLLHSLKSYKSGARKNAVMPAQVKDLRIKHMEDLAAYYAAQHSTLHVIPLHRLARDER